MLEDNENQDCDARNAKRMKLTPRQIARRWGISKDKVLNWIHSGELRAMDARSAGADRPRYLVDVKDLEDFEVKRTARSEHEPKGPTRRKKYANDVIDFF